jgi:hypothetical protein
MILLFSTINGYPFGQIMTIYYDFGISLNLKKIQINFEYSNINNNVFNGMAKFNQCSIQKKIYNHGAYNQLGDSKSN